MAIERDRSYEVSSNGITLGDSGIHISSGTAEPTHTGVDNDLYYESNLNIWRYQSGAWHLFTQGLGDVMLTDNLCFIYSNSLEQVI